MARDYTNAAPEGWKNFDLFIADMSTYRLPTTDALAGKNFTLNFGASTMTLQFDKKEVNWTWDHRRGQDVYEAVNTAPNVYFVWFLVSATNTECEGLVFNTETLRAVHVHDWVKPEARAGEPRIGQTFHGGVVAGGDPTGMAPHPTKDLTGLHAIYSYAEDHDYEHYYITSKYFCWKGLTGAQKGDCAMEPAEYWKFADGQYVFGWTEMIIPCSPIWFICFDGSFGDNRETGVFCNTNPDGTMRAEPAGALIQKTVQTFYPNSFGRL